MMRNKLSFLILLCFVISGKIEADWTPPSLFMPGRNPTAVAMTDSGKLSVSLLTFKESKNGFSLNSSSLSTLHGFPETRLILFPKIVQRKTPTLNPQVGISQKGDAVGIWVNGQGDSIEVAQWPAMNNKWIKRKTLSSPNFESSFPQIAVDSDGNAAAVWQSELRQQQATPPFIQSAHLFNGTWSNTETIGDEGTNAQIGVDAQGNYIAVWLTHNSQITYAQLPKNGNWTTPKLIFDAGLGITPPQLAVAESGNAVVVWKSSQGSIQASQFNGTKWSASPITISGNTVIESPQVGVDKNGNAMIIWTQSNRNNVFVFSAQLFVKNAVTTPPVRILHQKQSNDVGGLALVVDAKGNAVAGWIVDEEIQLATLAVNKEWQIVNSVQITNLPNIPQVKLALSRNNGTALAIWGDRAQVVKYTFGTNLFK